MKWSAGWIAAGLVIARIVGAGAPVRAQEQPQAAQETTHTLHVYMDLIQSAVLVLNTARGPMKPVDPARFRVSLDSGPEFKPKRVRMEGDDPITLGILLDVNSEQSLLMPGMASALAGLATGLAPSTPTAGNGALRASLAQLPAPSKGVGYHELGMDELTRNLDEDGESPLERELAREDFQLRERELVRERIRRGIDPALSFLRPQDHVSVYVLDCGLARTWRDAPADAIGLAAATDRALQPWMAERKERHRAPCKNRMGLWDAIRLATQELSVLPGRRVLLAVTDGIDRGRPAESAPGGDNWSVTREVTQRTGVAVFGLAPELAGLGGHAPKEDPFAELCELSGGMLMRTDHYELHEELARFVETVRKRYIVEFSRPRNDTPGEHSISVSILKTPAFIRPAGVSVSMPKPGERDGMDTVPVDVTDSPELGSRKVLKAGR